jgi:hypothetical protein
MTLRTTQTRSRRHSDYPRVIEVVPASPDGTGRFGRLFRELPVFEHSEAALAKLAETMATDVEEDKDLGVEDKDQNEKIPAGYTYLGQFIDHDLTFDPASSLQRQNDPNGLVNFRTPRFDLDSVYGRGPADQPYLYAPTSVAEVRGTQFVLPEGLHFLLGNDPRFASPDLPRNTVPDAKRGARPGRALIGDARNDENLIISQLHRTFLQFHNAVVDQVLESLIEQRSLSTVQEQLNRGGLARDVFKEAQRLVRWHYQWVVVRDFLPRICGDQIVEQILGSEADVASDPLRKPRLRFYPLDAPPFIPVEFSVAAYRFGHSMVRPSYFLNDALRNSRKEAHDEQLRVPILGPNEDEDSERLRNLNGFRAVPAEAWVQWKYFFEGLGNARDDDAPLPQFSYTINTELAAPLIDLPHSIAGSDSPSLAERNLLRGLRLGLPSGQRVARRMGITPLTSQELNLRDTVGEFADELESDTPLWYYVLKEAEVKGDGRLGEVGATIVAEVLIGLLYADPLSFLRVEPGWRPSLPYKGRTFDMTSLISFATQESAVGQRSDASAAAIILENIVTQAEARTAEQIAYEKLGEAIWDEMPYEYEGEPTLIANETERDGPARGYNQKGKRLGRDPISAAASAVGEVSEDSIRKNPLGSMWWYFDGKPHHLTKAVKLAYTVKAPGDPEADANGIVTKHILVGFQGAVAGGA